MKYIDEEHAQQPLSVLKQHHEVEVDWTGTKYCGINLEWDYQIREVHLFVQNYVKKALHRFQHEPPAHPQDSPHQHEIPAYGQTKQYAKAADTSCLLTPQEKTYVQQVIGTFLYYTRAVDPTMHTLKRRS